MSIYKESLYPFKEVENKFPLTPINDFFNKYNDNKKIIYILSMFAYPSGNLHCGHVRNFLYVDLLSRYYNYLGYNVLNPCGWDSFGLPAENAAKEYNIHPRIWTEKNIEIMKKTMNDLGFSVDWSLEISTHKPDYYYQQQKIFLDIFKNNLCYKKKGLVFWDPIENSVLSKDQVINGKGWRSGHDVQMKIMDQWYFKLTNYTEQLIKDLDTLHDWPQDIKNMQRQWMAPTNGFIIQFKIKDSNEILEAFTTKPQMIYGCTFLGLSLSHKFTIQLSENNNDINNFIKNSLTNFQEKDYRGIFTGYYGVNPVNNEEIPIYITTYVNNDFGTGIIYGVPNHNLNDYNFAQQHNLSYKKIIEGNDNFITNGIMINCEWQGLTDEEALNRIKNNLNNYPFIKQHTTYNLHDWCFSRQRYWGCPIPLINCNKCGIIPANLSNGPVILPDDVDFSLNGNPLDNHPTWKHTNCPQCNESAIRETNTMDTFVDSCWYFYRYFSKNCKDPIDKDLCNKVMPLDIYIGGREHAVSHLLYTRFFTKVLKDLGYINNNEPVKKLINQGFVCMATYYDLKNNKYIFPKEVVFETCQDQNKLENYDESKNCLLFSIDGNPVKKGSIQKMSKSKKNIIDPYEIKDIYGVDVLRFTMISDNPVDIPIEIRNESFVGASRFLNQVWHLGQQLSVYELQNNCINESNILEFNILLEKSQKHLKNLEVNLWAVSLRNMVKLLEKWIDNGYEKSIIIKYYNNFLKLLSIVCPYISQPLWFLINNNNQLLNNFIDIIPVALNNNIQWKIMINNKIFTSITLENNLNNHEIEKKVIEIIPKTIKKIFIINNRHMINIVI
jgi:leucyl-tRNA synthetase